MTTFIVERPVRGYKTYLVEAENKTQALSKINYGDGNDFQEVDFNTYWIGLATKAVEDK